MTRRNEIAGFLTIHAQLPVMRYKYGIDMYDWDSYKSLDAWIQLLAIFITTTVMGFPIIIGMIAVTGFFPVEMRLIPLYGVLSVVSAAGATILLWVSNHPNPWIRRVGLGILYLIPAAIILLFG